MKNVDVLLATKTPSFSDRSFVLNRVEGFIDERDIFTDSAGVPLEISACRIRVPPPGKVVAIEDEEFCPKNILN